MSKSNTYYPSYNPYVEIIGGRVHNLKNVNVRLPHGKLIVVTGVSGSGKSSLIFDLLYAESHRRYIETLDNNYLRNFINKLERPEVDKIEGLQSVIGIGQEISRTRSGRSTIGTLTDIYSFLRILYARAADAYSYLNGNKMERQSEEQIYQRISHDFHGQEIYFLAPLITGRKGHYRELFIKLYKQGFREIRFNGKIKEIEPGMKLDRYKIHYVDLVVGNSLVDPSTNEHLKKIIKNTLFYGKGSAFVMAEGKEPTYFSSFLMDTATGLSYPDPSPNTFSFNSTLGACALCRGFGMTQTINEEILIPDRTKSIANGGIPLLGPYKSTSLFKRIEKLFAEYGYNLNTPIQGIPRKVLTKILYNKKDTDSVRLYGKEGMVSLLLQKSNFKAKKESFLQMEKCPECEGKRLKKEALHFKIHNKNISELCAMNLSSLQTWLHNIEERLNNRQNIIAKDILKEIRKRLSLLLDMRLHYLSLDRPLQTLSGGEIRRIQLATQIGTKDSHLVGVMYILDEPSIGLHQRDNQYLIQALQALRDLGNTVIIIEHDKDTMLIADYLLEVGPTAGKRGGEIIAAGSPEEFLQQKSTTSDFLLNKRKIVIPKKRRKGKRAHILLAGCTGHNLKNIDVKIPLGKLIAITGVSGSGKSSLIHHTLLPVLKQHLVQLSPRALAYKKVTGLKNINKVIEVSQAPIGRTPRSNPATYTNLFSLIRDIFTQLPQAKIRGYKPGRFSFNVKGGRCEECKGAGIKLIEMSFLPSVRVPCETCEGRHYNRATLEVQYKGKSIADILEMTVETALIFFRNHPRIREKLAALDAVGLSYITLGQHATTLSGGEAQRVKLASELTKKDTGNTVYILDEPTTGLHFQDIQHLLDVLQKLVNKGNTVIIIEHNLDVIKVVDHIIDLGPEPGEEGGYIVAEGTPEEVAQNSNSHTGRFLQKEL